MQSGGLYHFLSRVTLDKQEQALRVERKPGSPQEHMHDAARTHLSAHVWVSWKRSGDGLSTG